MTISTNVHWLTKIELIRSYDDFYTIELHDNERNRVSAFVYNHTNLDEIESHVKAINTLLGNEP